MTELSLIVTLTNSPHLTFSYTAMFNLQKVKVEYIMKFIIVLQAQTFDGSGNPVLAVKGAKLSDFGGIYQKHLFHYIWWSWVDTTCILALRE